MPGRITAKPSNGRNSEANVRAAKANVENAQAEFDNSVRRENAEQMAVARAQFESALANLNAARATLANSQAARPFAATVLSLEPAGGRTVNAGVPVAYLGNTNRWKVRPRILPRSMWRTLHPGIRSRSKLDAFPDEEFTGTVTKIDPVGKLYGDMTYQITGLTG